MLLRKLIFFILIVNSGLFAQKFTKADTLRGTYNNNRKWWDLLHYQLNINVDIENKFISGRNAISFKTLGAGNIMQIDLQKPMQIDSAFYNKNKCTWKHIENAWLINLGTNIEAGKWDSLIIYYSGKPKAAAYAPWDGGLSWAKDEKNRQWIGVSCQGLGASVWWPNKDHLSDEPNDGVKISVTIPDTLVNISNGTLLAATKNNNGTTTWTYKVKNPINNYDVTMNIGNYIIVSDTFLGKSGILNIEYAMLDYNRGKIETHLMGDTKKMLRCFEHWFGPYPFYKDGYRLVETSYLGMEHQSAISYGNKFKKGYLGRDRSLTGIGMLWDFIVVHESGHEWFGNNITVKDIADMWIHEGFTTYSEVLFIEYHYNKDSANKYLKGLRKNILNDKPLIGSYGVNNESGRDIYDKGANMVHNIRQIMDNDSLFRQMLLGIQSEFAKKTITTKDIELYMIKFSGKDLKFIFNQYLRSTDVPDFDYSFKDGKLSYRWKNCAKTFNMPLRVFVDGKALWLKPTTTLQTVEIPKNTKLVLPDDNFYIKAKSLN